MPCCLSRYYLGFAFLQVAGIFSFTFRGLGPLISSFCDVYRAVSVQFSSFNVAAQLNRSGATTT